MERTRFIEKCKGRIPARWHMTLICLSTIASGVLSARGLHFFEIDSIALRYGLSVGLAYGVFFLLTYLWLRWHFPLNETSHARQEFNAQGLDALNVTDYSIPAFRTGTDSYTGGGGQFSGAGASGSWGDTKSSDSPSGKISLSGGDLDEGLIIILFIAVVAAISGSAIYIIYHAPEILFEAAFEAVLVAGVFRKAKGAASDGWQYSLFKRTWLPFLIVLVMACAFGSVLKISCPAATSYAEFRKLCKN